MKPTFDINYTIKRLGLYRVAFAGTLHFNSIIYRFVLGILYPEYANIFSKIFGYKDASVVLFSNPANEASNNLFRRLGFIAQEPFIYLDIDTPGFKTCP